MIKASQRYKDVAGAVFGYLIVVKSTGEKTPHGVVWECLCRCGAKVNYTTTELQRKSRTRGIRHTGIPKSCGCARRGVRSPRYLGAGDLSGQKWANLRRGAERRGFEFTITVQDAWALFEKQGRLCALTGLPVTLHPNSMAAGANTASLDRIDSSRGYTTDNVQWVHMAINFMKQTMSTEIFVLWCRAVVRHQDAAYARGETFGLGTKQKPHLY